MTDRKRDQDRIASLEVQIESIRAELGALKMRDIGRIDGLIAAINTQREGSQLLADSVGALAQCVAMVMEEEMGTPVADEPKQARGDAEWFPPNE